ncbi:carbamoyltransferase HypF [Streptomyces sp. H10-C2]|uniref:carbamoyltransferase HypF n=1 Tax=unclassified Streptomyces TaxID=2593676 RepID=UPI0024B9EE90|nr:MULTISPECIES: carbamoyltransferase HypF [unclassified Streptomyces]MDJ0346486.1 carbamoyltransferase HypF [Streptomyces sp. PH10-H1]MDJ0374980.1 carbamoyltransferase HypF [Streptomyces sp. H10-C2]
MCLGIPGRVVEIVEGYAGQLALVDVEGAQRLVNIGMLDDPPSGGDWVLLHMGFAVEVIDEAKAREALAGLELMGRGRARTLRRRFEVHGVVQGVGFRPFVYVTASELALTGSVANTSAGVVVNVEGDAEAVEEFGRRLRADAPPLAVVEDVHESDQPTCGGTGFTIEDSSEGGRARTLVSPDVAVCQDCLAELHDPANRRYRHPFITCTNCGPRFTIVTGTPYDRAATTMAGFAMCDACRTEYEDPRDRRFHAQPIACHACGPQLELIRKDGQAPLSGEDALRAARALLAEGRIVAVKGLGGYHLACDARNEEAVAELRRRKQRGNKPFAVMAADLDAAGALVRVTGDEEELLTGSRKPIVLLPRRAARPGSVAGVAATVADAVAPGNPDLGVMLPYTPLHVLLLGVAGGDERPGPDVLVMTSGNLSGEPIVTDDEQALIELAPLVDAWLRHDRTIQVPCDDSVSRFVAGAELPIRRSRGYAPLPLALPFDVPPMLAVGADLKNTCALAEGRYAWISQHIGDMDDLSTVEALTRTEGHLEVLTGVTPGQLVADRHPGYRSGDWARDHANGRAVRAVQHHHAHIASVMGEHGLGIGENVIGVAFDGTGCGTDGAAWGGEVLIADYKSFRRAAQLAYVPLAGGDASVLRPYRMALAHLHAAGVPWDDDLPPVRACPPRERDVLLHQFDTGFGCVPTSSMGRLFDAVASLAGVRHEVDYEAEAAIELEGLARTAGAGTDDPDDPGERYAFALMPASTGDPVIADPGPVIRAAVADARAGVSRERIAARFHASVAALIADLAVICREQTGLDLVALGGGVFQNALLLEAAQRTLTERGFTVLRPRLLPPNDGGLALGQLLIAASG